MLDTPSTLDASRYADCIVACNACAATCDFCAAACLREPDPRHMAKCIVLDMDCAGICRLAAATMARESPHVAYICELCARICELRAGMRKPCGGALPGLRRGVQALRQPVPRHDRLRLRAHRRRQPPCLSASEVKASA